MGTAVTTNTLFPQTTGLACDRPGIGVFQRTFCEVAASNLTGLAAPSVTPVAPGPRNCGQFCAFAVVSPTNKRVEDKISRFINALRRRCFTQSRKGSKGELIFLIILCVMAGNGFTVDLHPRCASSN